MPTTQSKNADVKPAKTEEEVKRISRKLLKVIGPAVFLNVISGSMLFTARQASVGKMFASQEDLASFLTNLVSASAFFELLANPIFGKLSDSYGRRPVIFIGNISTVICRFLMFLFSTHKWPVILEQLITVPLVTSFFTTWRASASDQLSGQDFARFTATVGAFAGLGLLAGPMVSKVIMRYADPKYCFLAATIFSASAIFHLGRKFEESLPVEKRVPLVINDMQPLSFLQVMSKTGTLFKLMCVTGLQSAGEGRNVNNYIALYMQNNLNWSWDQINNFVASLGIALIVSGLGSKRMMSAVGFANFTAFSNLANITSFVLYSFGTFNDWFMWLGLVAAIPGARKRDVVESLIMQEGTKTGFGKGFLSGSLMNWRAVVNTISPLFFGQVYLWGQRNNRPGSIWLAVALCTFSAQCVAWQLPNSIYDEKKKN